MEHADRIKPTHDSIGTYLENLKNKKYQIPTFQREIVWEKNSVKKLWDSIYKFYPIGSILVWKTDVKLQKHRAIGGHEIDDETRTSDFRYILDGQQRTTALLTSLYGVKGDWKKDFDPTLYVDLTVEEDENDDSNYKNRFLCWGEIDDRGGEVKRNIKRMKNYQDGLIVRLSDIRENYNEIEKDIHDLGFTSYDHTYRDNLRKVKHVLDNYRIPFIELKGIETEEVCEIFERVNQEGEPLNIFDIVVAKTFRSEGHPDGGFYLREMIDDFKDSLDGEYVKIDNLTYLQMLAMIIRQNIDDARVHNITETYLNKINAEQIEEVWDGAKKAFRYTFDFLENHLHIKGPSLIPYRYFYITIASYFYENDEPDYDLLSKYFWYYSFHNEEKLKHTRHLRYDHLDELEKAKKGEGFEFEPFILDRNDLRNASYSYRGRFSRAILSLLSNQDPKDWKHYDRSVLSDVYYHLIDQPNLHHIFPLNFVENYPGDNELDEDSLMNIAFIPQITNLEISDKNPIDYFKEYDGDGFEDVLKTHLIPEIILEWSRDDELGYRYLDKFIEKRVKNFEEVLKDKLEGIPFNVIDSRVHETNVELLIEEGEGQHLEFKSTFKTDTKDKGIPTRVIEYQCIRAINSFLNSEGGGKLLIGVGDEGDIYGLEEDYQNYSKDDKQEPFKREILDKISKYMDDKFNDFVDISFFTIDGKDVCMVKVEHSDSPAFSTFEGDEEFFVRRGNRTIPLSPSEQVEYINNHF